MTTNRMTTDEEYFSQVVLLLLAQRRVGAALDVESLLRDARRIADEAIRVRNDHRNAIVAALADLD